MAKFSTKPQFVTREFVEKTAKATQALYLAKSYEALLPKAVRLREYASHFPDCNAYILTSHIWTIRALQALKRNNIKEAIDAYDKDAHALNHAAHIVQAAQFKLDYSIKRFLFEDAIDALNETLTVLGATPQSITISEQAVELEIACAHFDAAKARLEKLTQDFPNDQAVQCTAHRLSHAVAYVTDDMPTADTHLNAYFQSLLACAEDTPELVEAMTLKANNALRLGHVLEAQSSRAFLKDLYKNSEPCDENALNNAIQCAELDFYAGNIKSALAQLDALSEQILSQWPSQNTHICRTLALTRCQISLDVDSPLFKPETCCTRLHSVQYPALPIEKVCADLIDVQIALLRQNFDLLDTKLLDIRSQCQFLNLNSCLPLVDATYAYLCYKRHDFDQAQQLALTAESAFERRHDIVSAARIRALRLKLNPQDIALDKRIEEDTANFIHLGHREIALTLLLDLAKSRLVRQNPTSASIALDEASKFIVPGCMLPKETKYKKLREALNQ